MEHKWLLDYIVPIAIVVVVVPIFGFLAHRLMEYLHAQVEKTEVEWDDKLLSYVDRLAESAVLYVENIALNQKRELEKTLTSKEKFDLAVERIFAIVEKWGVPKTLVENAVEAAHSALLGAFNKLPINSSNDTPNDTSKEE